MTACSGSAQRIGFFRARAYKFVVELVSREMNGSVRTATYFLHYSVLVHLVVRPAIRLLARILNSRIEGFLLVSASVGSRGSSSTHLNWMMEASLPRVLMQRALEACFCDWRLRSGSTLAFLVGSQQGTAFGLC